MAAGTIGTSNLADTANAIGYQADVATLHKLREMAAAVAALDGANAGRTTRRRATSGSRAALSPVPSSLRPPCHQQRLPWARGIREARLHAIRHPSRIVDDGYPTREPMSATCMVVQKLPSPWMSTDGQIEPSNTFSLKIANTAA